MFSKPPKPKSAARRRLHIGSGRVRLDGWLNVDIQKLPGVDVVADVTGGLDFSDVEGVFAEHFLEHLAIDDAVRFLLECHRILGADGWLRLSTPNLDWVWSTHYKLDADAEAKRYAALMLNRAFRGWRHQFLWNREILGEALLSCGFDEIRWCGYGESELPLFHGLEHHETYQDSPDLPHVIIAEARKGEPRPARLEQFRELIRQELLMHMTD